MSRETASGGMPGPEERKSGAEIAGPARILTNGERMNIYFDEKGTLAGLEQNLGKALGDGAGGLVVLVCEDNTFMPAALAPVLKNVPAPLIGGVFPAVIHCGRLYKKGSVVLGFEGQVSTAVIPGLSSEHTGLEKPLKELEDSSAGARTMVVFVDGFSARIPHFINSLFDIFGLEINYIGGGAGSLVRGRAPCLFSNSGMIGDGAVMALVETPSGVGVAHGWQAMSEPMLATETCGNVLKTIDFKPAFDVYAGIVKHNTGFSFGKNDFHKISKGYPFGIARINEEMIVRDPLAVTPDGSLICAGEIPQDSYISVMSGDDKKLMAAAQSASLMAVAALPGGKPEGFLLMDCISRLLFLEDSFKEELAGMAPPGCPSAGACTIGEIANSGAEFLEFYNKTAVVAAMGKK